MAHSADVKNCKTVWGKEILCGHFGSFCSLQQIWQLACHEIWMNLVLRAGKLCLSGDTCRDTNLNCHQEQGLSHEQAFGGFLKSPMQLRAYSAVAMLCGPAQVSGTGFSRQMNVHLSMALCDQVVLVVMQIVVSEMLVCSQATNKALASNLLLIMSTKTKQRRLCAAILGWQHSTAHLRNEKHHQMQCMNEVHRLFSHDGIHLHSCIGAHLRGLEGC